MYSDAPTRRRRAIIKCMAISRRRRVQASPEDFVEAGLEANRRWRPRESHQNR